MTREAYQPRGSSRRVLAGRGPVDDPAFYSYAYPSPPRLRLSRASGRRARFDAGLGEFLLPYEVVRRPRDPEAVLLAFLSTYGAAADLGTGTAPPWNARPANLAARARSEPSIRRQGGELAALIQEW